MFFIGQINKCKTEVKYVAYKFCSAKQRWIPKYVWFEVQYFVQILRVCLKILKVANQ